MVYIQEVEDWTHIPYYRDTPIGSYKEVDGIFREMKPLFAEGITEKYASKWDVLWYESAIVRTGKYGKYAPALGEWFFDSLIEINEILRKEEEERVERIVNPLQSIGPYKAQQLHRVYGHCYRMRNPKGSYKWGISASFWHDREHEDVQKDYDVVEMIINGWWPSIVREFGLLKGRSL